MSRNEKIMMTSENSIQRNKKKKKEERVMEIKFSKFKKVEVEIITVKNRNEKLAERDASGLDKSVGVEPGYSSLHYSHRLDPPVRSPFLSFQICFDLFFIYIKYPIFFC